ncbi:MAG: hypothetical protein WD876_00805 [Candidatus Pacearchaeota archaeon]
MKIVYAYERKFLYDHGENTRGENTKEVGTSYCVDTISGKNRTKGCFMVDTSVREVFLDAIKKAKLNGFFLATRLPKGVQSLEVLSEPQSIREFPNVRVILNTPYDQTTR